uniref:DNA-binding protein BIN4 n=1 Tax=Noccaea caerulescens TaxID=107243 RepID=A0A1J3DQB2_NOCCA
MSSSREGSPDWLRSYEAPTTTSLLSLSSSSKSSPEDSPYRESEIISSLPVPDESDATAIPDKESAESLARKNSKTKPVTKQVFSRKKKADASLNLEGKQNGKKVEDEEVPSKHKEAQGEDDSVWLLSSDSEPPSSSPIRQQVIVSPERDEDFVNQAKEGESAVKKAPKKKSPKKKPNSGRQTPKKKNSAEEILKTEDKDTDAVLAEEVTTDKNNKPCSGSSSRLPLVLSEKVNRTKVLVECEGDSIDLSGDMGAVGRVVVSDTTEDVYLDLKGTIYKSTIVPSRTFCIVNVSQSEAKIEAIMNDFIQLTPQSNVFVAETMMEGTLEGFSFDSDDEANKNAKPASKPADQSGGTEEVTKAKAKAKAKSENVSGKKRGRPSKEKQQPAKRTRNSAPKKTKPKK